MAHRRSSFAICALLLVLTLSLARAQYGPSLPIPSIGHRRSKPANDDKRSLQVQGTIRSIEAKTLLVGSSDGRTFNIALTEKTTYFRDGKSVTAKDLTPGATVQVEAAQDDQDNLSAVRIDLLKPATPEAPRAADPSPPPDKPTEATVIDSPVEAPNRPILHHGTERRRTSPNNADDSVDSSSKESAKKESAASDGIIMQPDASAAAGPARSRASSSDLITRTREWVQSFAGSLPNYVCQQNTTRYQEESKQAGWQALDVITAQVVYEDGKESYRDITVGGRKTNKSMLELGGSTSTGEFASTLTSLFHPGTQAKFKYFRSTRIGQAEAAIYDFSVALANSNWQIRVGGQTLRPAYSGSVWIDKNTAEVRRLEMQADNIPTDFPMDAVEWAVDYDKVPLGTKSFFLPIHAENLGCQRGTSVCMKNSVDFRNYRKFSGESTITFQQ
jgi:hypothetical protein